MKSVPLTAYPRAATGRNAVRKLRSGGRIPTVIYGRKRDTQALELNQRDLDKLISHSASENVLVDLSVESNGGTEKRLAFVQEVQHDPLTGSVLHIDFHEVAADEKVTITIPVESTGTPVGVKNGGVLEHVLFKLKVRGLPADLPLVLEVDVSQMDLGKVLHLGELPVPQGVEVLGNPDVPVFAVSAPKTETEAAAAEGAPTGDVEMIKEKKEEGGDAKKAEKK
jgi:large subunit ribosomal protein L25